MAWSGARSPSVNVRGSACIHLHPGKKGTAYFGTQHKVPLDHWVFVQLCPSLRSVVEQKPCASLEAHKHNEGILSRFVLEFGDQRVRAVVRWQKWVDSLLFWRWLGLVFECLCTSELKLQELESDRLKICCRFPHIYASIVDRVHFRRREENVAGFDACLIVVSHFVLELRNELGHAAAAKVPLRHRCSEEQGHATRSKREQAVCAFVEQQNGYCESKRRKQQVKPRWRSGRKAVQIQGASRGWSKTSITCLTQDRQP